MIFSSHAWMRELELKKATRINGFELWYWSKDLKSPLKCQEIQLVNPKWNQSRTFNWKWLMLERKLFGHQQFGQIYQRLTEKHPDAGKDLRSEENWATEDEMADGTTRWTWVWAKLESWWADREAWGVAVCGCKRSDSRLSNWTDLILSTDIW